MKRFSDSKNGYVGEPDECGRVEIPEIDAFLDDIEAVCRKHKMSIRHEDFHGAFTIVPFDVDSMNWLKDATDGR